MGGQRQGHRFIKFKVELLRHNGKYIIVTEQTAQVIWLGKLHDKFYVITKLECISRWEVALRVETLPLAEIRSNLNALLESFITVILWILVN